jgi:6-phosphogluconolactonase
MARRISSVVRLFIALAVLVSSLALVGGQASAKGVGHGAVFTLTNEAAGNAVAVFSRGSDGTLMPEGTVPTGGLGSGSGLGSQGAVALSENGRWLFAVNAGSDDVSVFDVDGMDLELVARVASGGDRPISLTQHGDLLYVLNGGTPNNITGFRIAHDGLLSAIAGSERPLSGANVGPAQVSFSPNGRTVVVTEKMTNKIDTFQVMRDGTTMGPNVQDAAGVTPFGFAFDSRGNLFVSEAFGGMANASALSSYDVSKGGQIQAISPSAPTHQTAACWTVVTGNGRYAYTTNAGSGSVSGYRIEADGSVTLLDADGRTGVVGDGTSPIDASVSNNSRFLYVLTGATHQIMGFEVQGDGSLVPAGVQSGLPASTVGLASR